MGCSSIFWRHFTSVLSARVFDLEMERVVLTEGPAYLKRPAAGSRVLNDRIQAEAETLKDYQKNTLIWRKKEVLGSGTVFKQF